MHLVSIDSKADSDYKVKVDQAVISLIRNKDHAVIMLERIKNGGYTVSLIDFMPIRSDGSFYKRCQITEDILKDKTYDGVVRNQSYTALEIINLEKLSLSDFLRTLKIRKAPPPRFEITVDKVVRRITVAQAQTFIDYIIEQQTTPPKFNIYGKNVARVVNTPEHNCTTWAIEALKEIKIELLNSNCCEGCLPAKAQDYTKGNEDPTPPVALPQVNVNGAGGCLIL